MTEVILAIDTGDNAASPAHDMGIWLHKTTDEFKDELVAAYRKLGFKPMIADPLVCSSCGQVGTYRYEVPHFAQCSECRHTAERVDFQPDDGELIEYADGILCVMFVVD